MPVDPNIALGFQPTQNLGPNINVGNALNNVGGFMQPVLADAHHAQQMKGVGIGAGQGKCDAFGTGNVALGKHGHGFGNLGVGGLRGHGTL